MNLKTLTKKANTLALLPLAIAASTLFNSALAHQHEAKSEPVLSFKTSKISDSIYMLSGEGGFTGGNIGLLVGDDGVVMIDNGLPSVIDILRKRIAETTTKPIDYLLNTHVHGDHIGNNYDFGNDGTKIVSHRNLRASLKKNGIGQEEFKAAPPAALPVITFTDEMTLHINGDAAHIIHVANAHTDGDAIIKFSNANVVHTGDIMFNGLFPYIDRSQGGSLAGVIKALQKIADLSDDNTQIIPGHGPLASKADVLTTIDMLEDAKTLVAAMIKDGKSDDDILAANPLSKYDAYSWGFITTEIMTKQVLANLR